MVSFLPRYYSVRAGTSTVQANGTVYQISRITKHPQFKQRTLDYNYALLELSAAIEYTDSANVTKLATNTDKLADGKLCTMYGFVNGQLTSVEIPKKSLRDCQTHFRGIVTITSQMIW